MHSVTHFMDRRTITALAVACAVSLPGIAAADDLEVYTGSVGSNAKPNILLVLDFSGSMTEGVDGLYTDVVADQKINVLRGAVNGLMDKYENNINLGLGSLYDSQPSGVRWPIAGLSDDPHTIDSDIPPNSHSMKDVINAQMDQRGAGGSTNTVSALVDAALYFQGGPVTHNDQSLTNDWSHRPDTWNNANKRYEGGNPYSALPASYSPKDAYNANAAVGNTTAWCRNYQVYDATKTNYCDGKIPLQPCTDHPPGVGLWDHDDNPDTPDIDGAYGGYESCEFTSNTSWNQP